MKIIGIIFKMTDKTKDFIYVVILNSLVILFCALILYLNRENSIFKNPTNIIEILGLSVLAIGSLIYIGATRALRNNYQFIRVGFNTKDLMKFQGALFVFFSVLIYFIIYYEYLNTFSVSIVITIVLLVLLIPLFFFIGYLSEIYEIQLNKNNTITLKMFVQDTSGNKNLKIIYNLELFQTTDNDYRFKDINKNELIVPIGQVQEIKSVGK